MAIQTEEPLLHWNYFLALEDDMSHMARFIEFTKNNFGTYSIELAHLLLTASSEIDVVAKQICTLLNASEQASNINEYHKIITKKFPQFYAETVFVPHHSLTLTPWSNWENKKSNPDWWKSYNMVKHERSSYFKDANLRNALNSMAALLVIVFYYYKLKFNAIEPTAYEARKTNRMLQPKSKLFRLHNAYYDSPLL